MVTVGAGGYPTAYWALTGFEVHPPSTMSPVACQPVEVFATGASIVRLTRKQLNKVHRQQIAFSTCRSTVVFAMG